MRSIIRSALLFGACCYSFIVRANDVDNRFGVCTHFAQGWPTPWIANIKGLRISSLRDEIYWQDIEPFRPSAQIASPSSEQRSSAPYQFPRRFDDYIKKASQAGISPLLILDYANKNYDGGNTPFSSDGLRAFAKYSAAVVQHYSKVDAVEIWNEYNGAFCDGPSAVTGQRALHYLELLKTTYPAIKQTSQATVVGADTVGVPLPYFKTLFAAGALDFMDAISVHPYRYDEPPEGIERDIERLRQLMKAYHREKPIWVTEFGWYLKPGQAPKDFPIDEATQAKFLVRACGLLLSAGVERMYWYDLRDNAGEPPLGLVDAKNQPRPAARAYSTLIKQLDGYAFVERETTADDFYSLLLRRKDGATLRLLWSTKPRDILVSGNATTYDLFGHRSIVNGNLHLTDSPVYLELSSQTSLKNLPPAEKVIADSQTDFSSEPEHNGWQYAFQYSGKIQRLTRYSEDEWRGTWLPSPSEASNMPHLGINADSQNPSASRHHSVPVIRRWISTHDGPLHLRAIFACPPSKGDGVTASVLCGGHMIFQARQVGGQNPHSVRVECDKIVNVSRGTIIDFVVGPGLVGNFDFDDTAVSVKLTVPAPGSLAIQADSALFSTRTGGLSNSEP